MVPATFVIGDDLPFRVDNVQSGRDHTPLTSATLTWQFLDQETRAVVSSGDMDQYDAVAASYEGVVPATDLGLYNAESNPSGIVPGRAYVLRPTILDGGIHTSKSVVTRAVLDPDDQP